MFKRALGISYLHSSISALSLIAALGVCDAAAAQTSGEAVPGPNDAPVQTAAAPGPAGISDIVVTARRREESIQNVPISIAAFGGSALAERQIDSSDKLTQLAPNVQFSAVAPASGNSSSSAIFIRGVGQTDFLASTDPGVGFYVDGVYFARASGTAISLLDVDRVEVLRGPQGTLFGRNTVGGAIQVFSARPKFDKIAGNIGVTLGDYNRRDVRGVLNLPVSNTLALRFAATKRVRDGYVTNILSGRDLGDVDTFAGRASLLWKPTDKLEVTLIGDYTKDDVHGSPTVFGGINTSAAFVRFASAIAGCPKTPTAAARTTSISASGPTRSPPMPPANPNWKCTASG